MTHRPTDLLTDRPTDRLTDLVVGQLHFQKLLKYKTERISVGYSISEGFRLRKLGGKILNLKSAPPPPPPPQAKLAFYT